MLLDVILARILGSVLLASSNSCWFFHVVAVVRVRVLDDLVVSVVLLK